MGKEEEKMLAQILAVTIFIAMFVLIITEVVERHIITLAAGALTLLLVFGLGMQSMDAVWSTLNLHPMITLDFWYAAGEAHEEATGINWATIIFIAGMMIMVDNALIDGLTRLLIV